MVIWGGRRWPCLVDGKLVFLMLYGDAMRTSIYCLSFPCLHLSMEVVYEVVLLGIGSQVNEHQEISC